MRQRIISIIICFSIIVPIFAQDVTTFLGIPVDGTPSAMYQALLKKGFKRSLYNNNALEGRFNGEDSHIFIHTGDNGFVDRIMVADANMRSEADIINRFNLLVSQFTNNGKYDALSEDQYIPRDEDISYEMIVHHKQYQAQFYQKSKVAVLDSTAFIKGMEERLRQEFTEEQLADTSAAIVALKDSVRISYTAEMMSKSLNGFINKLNRSVWFNISEYSGEYYICIYYDNENNRADGSDL